MVAFPNVMRRCEMKQWKHRVLQTGRLRRDVESSRRGPVSLSS